MFLRFVLVVEVVLASIMMSFIDVQDYEAGPPGWTLTRQAILTLRPRPTASKLDRCTQRHILSLGCVARRRGCRGGQRKVKPIPECYSVIPVIIGNRRNSSHAISPVGKRQQFLTTVRKQQQQQPTDATSFVLVGQCERRDDTQSAVKHIDQTLANNNISRILFLSSAPPLYVLNAAAVSKPRFTFHRVSSQKTRVSSQKTRVSSQTRKFSKACKPAR